ncbi:histidine phosphatase family protein [Epibacterium sp. SM1969]|uniref:Histidine phosphatase family protein n=1 Tax=Tritonibacter aquimaris TaxID=2663379 RepID=A0A844AN59_9RHOB|nr:histidine phosphatase family protein [Tritonibacter aquimaris]MQY43905.1 histidine phosphatase family protein [Tritonibacter aquimaris]
MSNHQLPDRSFCLIRHGQTTANEAEIMAGATEVPLSPLGEEQALGLRGFDWPAEIQLFSSPMGRAQTTCQLGFPGQAFALHAGLRERHWGIYEGAHLSTAPPRHGRPEGGEDWEEMILRVAEAITECCAKTPNAVLPVMICHSGVIRAARATLSDTPSTTRPANGQPVLFRWDGTTHHEEPFNAR